MNEQKSVEEEIFRKIKKLHKKLESETNKKYQITIQSNLNESLTIGDFSKRKQYQIYDMEKVKELEDTYDSLEELNETLEEYCNVKSIKNLFVIDTENGVINYGKGKLTTLGKLKIKN